MRATEQNGAEVGPAGKVILSVEGDLDVARARQAGAEVMKRSTPHTHLVIDLSRVARFDFSGIVVLADCLARSRGRFASLTVLVLSERLRGVFAALHAQTAEWTCVNHPGGRRSWS